MREANGSRQRLKGLGTVLALLCLVMTDAPALQAQGNRPNAPTNLTATGLTSGTQVRLDWTRPTSGGPFTGGQYRVKAANGSYGSWTNVAIQHTDNAGTGTVTGLTPDTEYTFQLKIKNSVGTGPASNEATARTTLVPGAPGAPTNLTATALTAGTKVRLDWTRPSGAPFTGGEYRAKRAGGPYGSWASINVQHMDAAGTAEITGLSANTEYTFQLRLKNSSGRGARSSEVNVRTLLAAGAPSAPTNVTATALSGGESVRLDWTRPTSGSPFTGGQYRAKAENRSYSNWTDIAVQHSDQAGTAEVTGLTPNTDYTIQLRLKNSAGTGVRSNEVSVTTLLATGAPSAPINLTATALPGGMKVKLSWTRPTSGEPFTGGQYRVSVRGGPFGNWTDIAVEHADQAGNAEVSGVMPNNRYSFQLRLKNSHGTGAKSGTANVTVAAPGAPPGLAATPTTSEASLTWNGAPDNGGGQIAKYQVRHAQGSSVPATTVWTDVDGGATARAHTVTNLTTNTEYTFEVRGVNSIIPGPAAAVTVTTAMIDRPEITGVAFTSDPNDDGRPGNDDTYAAGDTITITVTFDEPITVTGTPEIKLELVGRTRDVPCSSMPTTSSLACSYTVKTTGDRAPDGAVITANSFTPKGGKVTKTSDTSIEANARSLEHPQVGGDGSHKVDGVGPGIDNRIPPESSSDGLTVTVTFNEEIGSATANSFTIYNDGNGTNANAATAELEGKTVLLTHTVSVTAADNQLRLSLNPGAVTDLAGNINRQPLNARVFNNYAEAGYPSAVRNLRAAAKNQEVQLFWDKPAVVSAGDDDTFVFAYEYRQRAGTNPWGDWTATPQSPPIGGATIKGLDNDTEYSFQVRAKNRHKRAGPDGRTVTATPNPKYRASLSRWGIRRGGDPTKATLTVSNGPFREARTYAIEWNGQPTDQGLLHSGNATSVTLPAGDIHASVNLRAAADDDGATKVYNREVEHPLVYKENGTEVVRTKPGDLWDGNLSVHDNEPEPVASLEAPAIVDEGEDFRLTVRFGHRLDQDADIRFGFSNPSRAKWNLTGVPDPRVITIPEGELMGTTGPIRKPDNTDKDTDTEITFVLKKNRDEPWLLGHGARGRCASTTTRRPTPSAERGCGPAPHPPARAATAPTRS